MNEVLEYRFGEFMLLAEGLPEIFFRQYGHPTVVNGLDGDRPWTTIDRRKLTKRAALTQFSIGYLFALS